MPQDPIEWLQAIRLVATVVITTCLGAHAYWRHTQEALQPLSSQRWVYWIYAAAFLVMSVLNFGQAWLVFGFGEFGLTPVLMGYVTLLVTLSYVALLVGTKASKATDGV